ncbi:MAG: RND transporter [Candidatus Thiodiazotropha sp. (ex Epidulcina cf. delphinae)]|nr:RND transporter [Candidatus Thiodiazotropha sp. (ex Epidulcina cf. delphinae)]
MFSWLDRISLRMIAIAAVLLGLAPVFPEPHLLEKLKMLVDGGLHKPIDIFDLFLHGSGVILLIIKLIRDGREVS